MWNNLEVRERNISTVQAFKRSLLQYFDIENYNKLYDFAIDRFSSIIIITIFSQGVHSQSLAAW